MSVAESGSPETGRRRCCRRRRLPWLSSRIGWTLHHLAVVLVLIPAGLAALGAAVEAALYKPGFEPRFHMIWLPVSGWIAAPFILLRVFWKWPRYLLHLDLAIYVVMSGAYFAAVAYTVIVGSEYYVVNSGIRDLLQKSAVDGGDLYRPIATPGQVWTWLEHVVGTVYSSDAGRGLTARTMPPTRLMMLTSLKLRQHRVRPVCCSQFNRVAFPEGSRLCYPMYAEEHESRDEYGTNQTFAFSDVTTQTATGHELDPRTFAVGGDFADYPLAGFSTFFPPGVRRATALRQLRAMRASGWLDEQTRAVVVELALTTPDFLDDPVWAAAVFLVERDRIGRYATSQPKVYLNYFAHAETELSLRGGGELDTCGNGSELKVLDLESGPAVDAAVRTPTEDKCAGERPGAYMLRFYQGVFPVVVYTVFMTARGLRADWRHHLQKVSSWSGALWSALLLLVWAYKLYGFRLMRCSLRFVRQPPFAGLVPESPEGLLSQLAPKTDYLPFAHAETQSRRFLAISIFVRVFGILRFLVHLKALGVMVRTLHFSAASLLSFSLSFLVVFFGFIVMFFYVFSVDSRAFSDIPSTVTTLWLGMLGEVQLTDELYRERDWTIGLYIVFTFVSAFVLLTLIISIVSNAHDRAMRETAAACDDDDDDDDVADGRAGVPLLTTSQPPPRQQRGSHAAAEGGDVTRLVSEGDVLSSAVRRWRQATARRRRARAIAPGDGRDDDAATSVGRSSTDMTALSALSGGSRVAFGATTRTDDDDVADEAV